MAGRGRLRGAGAVGLEGVELVLVDGLLERYRGYLLLERELDPATVVGYAHRVRPFLAARVRAAGLDLAGLTAGDVNAFVLADCRWRTRQSAKLTVTALRSLLRFLQVDGVISEALAEGVPSVADWRLSGLPQHLEPDQVRALFDACDRATPSGVRAFAILKLLVRLGLRRCEVARLRLDDIDWRSGEVVIRGKRDRHDRLPLPPDVGQALVDYLQRVRPREVPDRHVFISAVAPYRALSGPAISHVVARCGVRAGLGEIGAHRLRHTGSAKERGTNRQVAQTWAPTNWRLVAARVALQARRVQHFRSAKAKAGAERAAWTTSASVPTQKYRPLASRLPDCRADAEVRRLP